MSPETCFSALFICNLRLFVTSQLFPVGKWKSSHYSPFGSVYWSNEAKCILVIVGFLPLSQKQMPQPFFASFYCINSPGL